MLVDTFSEVSKQYADLEGYLNFKTLKTIFAAADACAPENALTLYQSINMGQYDPGNEFSRMLLVALQFDDQEHRDRHKVFYEIFHENRESLGQHGAMESAFDHYARCNQMALKRA